MMKIKEVLLNNPHIRHYFLNKKYKRTGLLDCIKGKLVNFLTYVEEDTNYKKKFFTFMYVLITTTFFYYMNFPVNQFSVILMIWLFISFVPLLILYAEKFVDDDYSDHSFYFVISNIGLAGAIICAFKLHNVYLGIFSSCFFIAVFREFFKNMLKAPFALAGILKEYFTHDKYTLKNTNLEKKDHIFLTEHLKEEDLIEFLNAYPTYSSLPLSQMQQMEKLDINGIKREERKEVIEHYARSLYEKKK